MQCPKCGTENPAGKILCRACGARLRLTSSGVVSTVPAPHESDQDLRRWLTYDLARIVWVMAVVIGVGLGLGVLLK
jgi:hypothetical protein